MSRCLPPNFETLTIYKKILTYIFITVFKSGNSCNDKPPYIKNIASAIIIMFFKYERSFDHDVFREFSKVFKEEILTLIPDGNWAYISRCLNLDSTVNKVIQGWRSDNKYSWNSSRKISKGWKRLGFGGKKTKKSKKSRKTRKYKKYRK